MNDFDELIDADVPGDERERLRGVHEMLVQAGRPAELSDVLREAPRPGEVRFLQKQSGQRKLALLAAALIVIGAAFIVGFASGEKSTASAAPIATLILNGTKAAPNAHATLDLQQKVAGNWPMTLSVRGLPKVAAPEYYYVWLVRNGQPWAPCGEFVVSKSSSSVTMNLTAPYTLHKGDTWIVTRQRYGRHAMRTTVLRPTSTL